MNISEILERVMERKSRCSLIRCVAGTTAEEIAEKRKYVAAAEEIIAAADHAKRFQHKRPGYHIHHVTAWWEIPGERKRSLLVGSIQNREENMVYLTYRDHITVHICEYLAYGISWKSGLKQMLKWMYEYHGIEMVGDGSDGQLLEDFEIHNTDKKAWPASRKLLRKAA